MSDVTASPDKVNIASLVLHCRPGLLPGESVGKVDLTKPSVKDMPGTPSEKVGLLSDAVLDAVGQVLNHGEPSRPKMELLLSEFMMCVSGALEDESLVDGYLRVCVESTSAFKARCLGGVSQGFGFQTCGALCRLEVVFVKTQRPFRLIKGIWTGRVRILPIKDLKGQNPFFLTTETHKKRVYMPVEALESVMSSDISAMLTGTAQVKDLRRFIRWTDGSIMARMANSVAAVPYWEKKLREYINRTASLQVHQDGINKFITAVSCPDAAWSDEEKVEQLTALAKQGCFLRSEVPSGALDAWLEQLYRLMLQCLDPPPPKTKT